MFTPSQSIVPVVALVPSEGFRLLGTASFVVEGDLLLTADHVIGEWRGEIGICLQTTPVTVHKATTILRDNQHDIALLRVTGYKAPRPLSVPTDIPYHLNQFVAAFEFGSSVQTSERLHLSPATRIGNITRILDLQDRFGPGGESMLELSFPALKGASGAPVITNDGRFAILGMLVANVGYHLLPVQVETVLDQRNEILEEIKYLLPQALAVNSRHIAAAIARVVGV